MTQEDTKRVTKVVITLSEGTGFIGIQAAECDPFFTSVQLVNDAEDTMTPLEEVLLQLPTALVQAQDRWQEQAKNPTYERPVPEVRPATPRATPTSPGRQTPATEQNKLF